MYDQFKELADVDITTGPMEVGPTTHYMMGGIRVDAETGATTVPGLYAAGEVAAGHARREPARRQLAVRPARVRGADRRRSRGAHAATQAEPPYLDPVQVQGATRELGGAARARRRRGSPTPSSATSRR